nr:hypothetical protein [Alphaproteobacteria bacterium]
VYGVDLVEWMLRIADGQTLPPDGVGHKTPNGHSFEARLYAEDPAQGSLPSTGTVTRLCPPDCRFESGIEEGNTVTPFFDPMIAKIITHGNTREAARHRMLKALETLVVDGVKTNRVLLLDLFKQSVMVEGRISTHTFETLYPESYLPDDIAQTTRDEMSDHHRQRGTCPGAEGWWVCSMAGFALAKQAFDTDEFGLYLPEENPDNHHVTRHWLRQIAEEETAGGTAVHYALSHLNDSADTPSSILTEMGQPGRWRPIDTSEVRNTKGFRAIHNPRDRTVAITVDDAIAVAHDLNVGETYTVHYEQTSAGMTLLWQNRTVTLRILPYRAALLTAQLPKRVTRLAEGKVIAPMPGMIARLMVHNGMAVHAGDTLLVLEAMKMESPVVAPRSGTIASMALTEGQTVDAGATLCEVTV